MGRPIYSPSFDPYTTEKKSNGNNNKTQVPTKAKRPPQKPIKVPK